LRALKRNSFIYAEMRVIPIAWPHGAGREHDRAGDEQYFTRLWQRTNATEHNSPESPSPPAEGADDDETIAELAALSLLEYDRRREAEAERLGMRFGIFD